MDKPMTVLCRGKKVAMIFRKSLKVQDVKFFTDRSNPFQIGIHDRAKGITLSPHIHVTKRAIHINVVQELLMVLSGRIKVMLTTDKGEKIRDVILKDGDSILLMSHGHGVEFLEKSRIFMVKQGPFSETTHVKVYTAHQKL